MIAYDNRGVPQTVTFHNELDRNEERDCLLLEAIEKWVDREFDQSHKSLSNILIRYPKDILTLFASHMLEFHMGWTMQMRDTIQQVLPAWTESDPLYGYVKGI